MTTADMQMDKQMSGLESAVSYAHLDLPKTAGRSRGRRQLMTEGIPQVRQLAVYFKHQVLPFLW